MSDGVTQALNIPKTALVRFIALMDNEAEVTMNAAQAASLSKFVADQAAATEWEEEGTQEEAPDAGEGAAVAASTDDQQQQQPAGNEQQQQGAGGDAGDGGGAPPASPPQEIMIPVPIGSADNLRAVVRYLSARLASPQREIPAPLTVAIEDAVDDCDKTFLRSLANPHRDVVALASVAHHLNIPSLRDLMCATMAAWMTHMSVEQMRSLLGVANDFSEAEHALLKKEYNLEEMHMA